MSYLLVPLEDVDIPHKAGHARRGAEGTSPAMTV
jgi:hypothetical protein